MPPPRLLLPPPEIWSKTIEVCITIDFALKKFLEEYQNLNLPLILYHAYGRKLTVLWDERELGNSVMLFTCFCCCCCPSQCALPTQCPIWASCLQEVLQLDSFSNVKKLYRVTAWVLRFINNLDRKVHNEVLNLSRCLDRTEINASELLWLHDNQKNISQNKNYCQSEKSLV